MLAKRGREDYPQPRHQFVDKYDKIISNYASPLMALLKVICWALIFIIRISWVFLYALKHFWSQTEREFKLEPQPRAFKPDSQAEPVKQIIIIVFEIQS